MEVKGQGEMVSSAQSKILSNNAELLHDKRSLSLKDTYMQCNDIISINKKTFMSILHRLADRRRESVWKAITSRLMAAWGKPLWGLAKPLV